MLGNTQTMIAGTHAASAHLGRVLVLGLGKSGCAAADYCLNLLGGRVDAVAIAAGERNPGAEEKAVGFEARGARVLFDTYEIAGRYDLCIASPGISQFGDFYRSAQATCGEVVSEVEFAWRESADTVRWAGITGTNGKTTTTALAAHLLQTAGIAASAVGNIGDTCLDAVTAGGSDVLVAEVSSYQLASTRLFAPEVSVLLNITPDHIKWHGSFEAYADAKKRVYANQASVPGALAVFDATDDEARECMRALKAQGDERGFAYLAIGTKDGLQGDMRATCGAQNAAFLREGDGMLCVCLRGSELELIRADELHIKGSHNMADALAAASVALTLGGDPESVRAGLRSFAPLEHRIEPAGFIGGVECYNDSKATNVDATLKALSAFDGKQPIVLLGGDDKGTDLSALVRVAEAHCKAVVCFGAAGPRFADAFEGACVPAELASGMESALDAALGIAQPGDIVLLSPACASFDEFEGFPARGRAFKQMVSERARATAAQGDA